MVNAFQLDPALNSVLWRKAYRVYFTTRHWLQRALGTAVMGESPAWFPLGSSTRGTAAVASAHLYFWQVMFGVRVSCRVPWALSPSWHALFSALGLSKIPQQYQQPMVLEKGLEHFRFYLMPFLVELLKPSAAYTWTKRWQGGLIRSTTEARSMVVSLSLLLRRTETCFSVLFPANGRRKVVGSCDSKDGTNIEQQHLLQDP